MQQDALLLMILSVGIIFGGLLVRCSKVYYYIQVFLLVLLAGLNTESQDFLINETLYYLNATYNDIGAFDYIYRWTAYWSNNLGLSFIEYNFCISTISILLIAYVIKRECHNYNIAIIMLFLYPFAEMIIQKRFLPAMAIMLFGLKYLNDRNLSGNIKYIACLLIACGLHTSSLFYIVFFMLSKVYKKMNTNIIS